MIIERLKLYDTKLTIRINKKDKKLIKKNAYNRKMTLSDYLRYLIKIDNRINDINKRLDKSNKQYDEIKKYKVMIGSDDNV